MASRGSKSEQKQRQGKFRADIQDGSKETPRFLFRFWSNKSGGDAGLNTMYNITPLHFYKRRHGPERLHEMDPKDVDEIATKHLCTRYDVETVFSSWSQDFFVVYTWAMGRRNEEDNVHISLLDTKRLPDHNAVLHTSKLCTVLRKTSVRYPGWEEDQYPWEYLIFGQIKAPAYTTTSLLDLLRTRNEKLSQRGLSALHRTRPEDLFTQDMSLDSRIDAVRRISLLFGNLSPVMAAHLITSAAHHQSEHEDFVRRLSSTLMIPPEWSKDTSIEAADTNFHGHEPAKQGAEFLLKLVIAAHGATASSAKALSSGMGGEITEEDSNKATKAVVDSDRVPAAVKLAYPKMMKDIRGLRITMEGYAKQQKILDDFKGLDIKP